MRKIFFVVSLLFLISAVAHAEIKNFGSVVDGIVRGSAPRSFDDYRLLQEKGVTHILSLESFFSHNEDYCHKTNQECLNFPIFLPPIPYLDRFFDYETLKEAFFKVLEIKASDPMSIVYIHCYFGSDRTGALSSALMIREMMCRDEVRDVQDVLSLVTSKLEKHNFHLSLYPYLYEEILSWVKNRPAWICADAL